MKTMVVDTNMKVTVKDPGRAKDLVFYAENHDIIIHPPKGDDPVKVEFYLKGYMTSERSIRNTRSAKGRQRGTDQKRAAATRSKAPSRSAKRR